MSRYSWQADASYAGVTIAVVEDSAHVHMLITQSIIFFRNTTYIVYLHLNIIAIRN